MPTLKEQLISLGLTNPELRDHLRPILDSLSSEVSLLRGHPIQQIGKDTFVYCDTGEPTVETWKDRPCGHCGQHNTPEGHDACFGTLPGPIQNACCGHGEPGTSYIQFEDGSNLRGYIALSWVQAVKKNKRISNRVLQSSLNLRDHS